MKRRLIALIVLLAISSALQASQCSGNFSDAALQTLKNENFVIEATEDRNKTAVKLLLCLGSPDPKVRDGIVYEATSEWLRGNLLDQVTIKTMFDFLINTLEQTNQDPLNFTQPFAALVLSEVLRVDRIKPYLTENELQKAIKVTTSYMVNIVDYRGFDDLQGWRHAVAHTADVILQLSLNNKVSKVQLGQLLDALKSQVSPQQPHFYVFGEPKRLAMAFIYIVLRGEHTEQEVASYLESVASPAPFNDWQSVYSDKEGLAKLHNTRNFIYSIFAISARSENSALKSMQPKLAELIKKIG
ncbi:DUF2785 domain-containing protein [Paraglaciecola arctica]|uniref:DUF2785 domain-containing protein n=1 Tax=Paraglaciecola arctica BSs20135 TaxID=493475 RepID=K6YZP1_9ALTE|nr:DUF2785 domain-containing protein [Paraglaciecola arctica]GAC22223.1 hypothetical protein GARC_5288 [Paraglaciecola arctica BSs20135]